MKKTFLITLVILLPLLMPKSAYSQQYGLFISEVYQSDRYYTKFHALEIYNNNPDSVYDIRRLRIRVFRYNQGLNDQPVAVRFINPALNGNYYLSYGQAWTVLSIGILEDLAQDTSFSVATFNTVKDSITSLNVERTSLAVGGDKTLALNGNRTIVLEYDLTPSQTNWNLKQWQVLDVFGRFNETDSSFFGPFYSETGWADGVTGGGLMTRKANLIRKSSVVTGRTDGTTNFGFIIGQPGTGALNAEWEANTPTKKISSHTDTLSLQLPNSTLGEHTAIPLPVELATFSAKASNGAVVLEWKTNTELNNYGFEIQRRSDKKEWEKIGFVKGSGNSSSVREYSFIDKNVGKGYFEYRLKQIDFDGKYEFSSVASVVLIRQNTFELLGNYPNPFNPTTTISFILPDAQFVKLTIYNSLGQQIKVLANGIFAAGYHEINFDATGLQSGIYFYKLESAGLFETKKMIYAK